MTMPAYLTRGEPARLIPAVADTNREQRAASIVLAALRSVQEFRHAMLASLGVRVGNRSQLGAWTEVCLRETGKDPNSKCRPDGLLVLDTGRSQWRALIEAKIGVAELGEEQIKQYVAQAKAHGIDAVITISNQFVAIPSHHPVQLQKNVLRGVSLFHWSWMYVVTQATLLLEGRAVASDDQRYILNEVLRFLSHDSSGVSRFDRMNREWKDLIGKVQTAAPIKGTDSDIQNTTSSWHQEQRDLGLVMTRKLGQYVQLKLSRAHRVDPIQRLRDDSEILVRNHALTCTFEIPNAASELEVCAHLGRRTISCSMRISAPLDKKGSSARVNWLTRQLHNTCPNGIFIKAIRPGRADETQATLAAVLADPDALTSGSSVPPSQFEVFYLVDLANRFSGSKVFIEELEKAVPYFYEQVGQRLRAWVAPPPAIRQKDPVTENYDPPPQGTEAQVGTAPHAENVNSFERLDFGGSSKAGEPAPATQPIPALEKALSEEGDQGTLEPCTPADTDRFT